MILAPQVGTQEDFINTDADIVFYGGAAGSGKSYALLLDPLQHIHDPDYNAIMFRQNNTQLDGSLWPAASFLESWFEDAIPRSAQVVVPRALTHRLHLKRIHH